MSREQVLQKVLALLQQHKPNSISSLVRTALAVLIGLRLLHQFLRTKGWMPKKSVNGQHVVITGAGSGIGRQMALMLSRKGAKVSIWDINLKAAQAVQHQIETTGHKAFAQQCDVTNKAQVEECADQAERFFGTVDILINNAGIVSGKNMLQLTEGQIRRCLDVNTVALHWTVQRLLPAMLRKNHGHVVTIASLAGLVGTPGLMDYNASKFGAVGFNEALRAELTKVKSQVRTTLICPSFIDTGMFAGVKGRFQLVTPVLSEKYAAWRIVQAMLQDEQFVVMPVMVQLMLLLRAMLPTSAGDWLQRVFGGLDVMDHFQGRQ